MTSMKSLLFLLLLLLLLSPIYARKPSIARTKKSGNLKFGPRKIQERFYNHNKTPKVMTVKKAETWSFSIRTVIPGSLTSDVKANRADYENSFGPLFALLTSDSSEAQAVECTQGNGWFYVAKNTPYMKECLPWWNMRPELRRFSMAQPAPGEPDCSFSVRQSQYPQCGVGRHCDTTQGKCVLTTSLKSDPTLACPADAGLVWSKSKQKCVQCLVSNFNIPKRTSSFAPSDYYRSGYVCDSDGNSFPPLAAPMASQLYTEPTSSLYLAIFLCIIISTIVYAFLWFKHVIS